MRNVIPRLILQRNRSIHQLFRCPVLSIVNKAYNPRNDRTFYEPSACISSSCNNSKPINALNSQESFKSRAATKHKSSEQNHKRNSNRQSINTINNKESLPINYEEALFRAIEIFSGRNSPLPFYLYQVFGRWIWSFVFNYFCNTSIKPFHKNVEHGAMTVLFMLFDKIKTRDWTWMEQCFDSTLFSKIKTAIDNLHDLPVKFNFDLHQINGARLIHCGYYFGGNRDTSTLEKSLVGLTTPIGFTHYVVDQKILLELMQKKSKYGGNSRTYRKFMFINLANLLREAMKDGGLVRVDVVCKVKQVISAQTNLKLYSLSPKLHTPETAYHVLRFEAPLEPASEFLQDESPPRFDWTEGWKLVDFNSVLRGNFPFDIKENKIEMKTADNEDKNH